MIDFIYSKHVVLSIGTDKPEIVKGLRIKPIKDNFYSVRGSLHKYKNDGLHNADDYYLSDFKNTLNQLSDDFDLNADIAPLNGFEFGVNIKLPTNPKNALERLILHKTEIGDRKKDYKKFEYNNHSFKFYNKSGLTKIEPYKSGNILRIEIRVDKMEFIRNQKHVYLTRISDLLDVAVWEQLEKILIETINECLIIDFSKKEVSLLSTDNHIQYLKYVNSSFWERIYNETRKNRNKYTRERAKCEEFISQYSKSTLKIDIINLIRAKCKELRDISKTNEVVKKWDKLTIIQTINEPEKWDKLTRKIRGQNVPTEPTEPDNVKHCISCGKIIPNPRKNSKFCSELINGKDGKQCRNKNSNPRNNTIRAYKHIIDKNPLLFDITIYIAPDKRKYL
jgi:hypothetical protein